MEITQTLHRYKEAVLLLFLTLTLVVFHPLDYLNDNLPFLKLGFPAIRLNKSSSPPPPASSSQYRLRNCDLFNGKWVPYPKGPQYTNGSQCVIDGGQNCIKYGRKDTEYLKWRWKPDDCELPLFDAARFLELVKGKSMAFVGDSVARNQMESLGCLLSSATSFVDVSDTKDPRFRHWFYKDHNFTIQLLTTTHLLEARGVSPNPFGKKPMDLYLDKVDKRWATQVENFDYVIISSGHWFSKVMLYYENGNLIGCSACNRTDLTDITGFYGYRAALETSFRALIGLEGFKGMVILRTISPAHFEWDAGERRGACPRTTPYSEKETRFDWYISTFHMIQTEEFLIAKRKGRKRGLKFRLLDVTGAMKMRPDGHPNRHGPKKRAAYDCLHWCLPGPIDLWNELLFQLLEREEGGEGSTTSCQELERR